MKIDSGEEVKTALVVEHFMPEDNHHPLLGFYVHQSRRKYFTILSGVAAVSALFSFALTGAIVSARPVQVTFALPSATNAAATPAGTVSANSAGQTALTEAQLKVEVGKIGGSIFWAGAMTGAKYAFNHNAPGQDFIRYLPNGQGLADIEQNYRIIATYKEVGAHDTLLAASKVKTDLSVSLINPDGSVIYYAKTTPTHVYLAFKGVDYQIEIFDPKLGAALKLATTPGAIVSLL